MSTVSRADRPGVSRRAVLGAAVVGGAGVAAARLWGGDVLDHLPALGSHPNLAGRGDWNSPLGSETAQVAQLLRRATFGAGPADLEKALGDGFAKTADRLVETLSNPQEEPGESNRSRLPLWLRPGASARRRS